MSFTYMCFVAAAAYCVLRKSSSFLPRRQILLLSQLNCTIQIYHLKVCTAETIWTASEHHPDASRDLSHKSHCCTLALKYHKRGSNQCMWLAMGQETILHLLDASLSSDALLPTSKT